jgi:hypothetical protein
MTTENIQATPPIGPTDAASSPSAPISTDIALATGTASLVAGASGNPALAAEIAAGGQIAALLSSSMALAASGHISHAGMAHIKAAALEAAAAFAAS